jgi:hypothetical protein
MGNIRRRDLMKGILATAAAMAFTRTMRGDQATENDMMEVFRQVGNEATVQNQTNHQNFVGGFPNFCIVTPTLPLRTKLVEAIFIKSDFADWKNVELSELRNVSLDDFAGRMRAAHDYAMRHGYLAGFPTFFDAPVGANGHRVCGTVLIKNQANLPGVNPPPIIVRNLSLPELGNVSLNDPLGRFIATKRYAYATGFAGGFPTMHHANLAGEIRHSRIVCGTVLFSQKYFPVLGAPLKNAVRLTSSC